MVFCIFYGFICTIIYDTLNFIASTSNDTNRFTRNEIQIFFKNSLISENHLHQIFIRLREKCVVKNRLVYYLVLEGQDLDKLNISSYSSNLELVRKLGKKIALNLGVNFFDILNISKHHVVLNHCPSSYSSNDLWDFLINQRRIIIEKQPFYWKRLYQNENDSELLDRPTNYPDLTLREESISNVSMSSKISNDSRNNISTKSLNYSIKSLSSQHSTYNNSNYEQAQEAVLTFKELKNHLDILTQQINAIKSLKKKDSQ